MAAWRMRLLPRGLAGWSLLILINLLLLMSFGQWVILRLIAQEVSSFVERDSLADRVFVLDKMFRQIPAEQWAGAVAALNQPNFKVALVPADTKLLAERAHESMIFGVTPIMGRIYQHWKRAEALRDAGSGDKGEADFAAAERDAENAIAFLNSYLNDEDPALVRVARMFIGELENVRGGPSVWDHLRSLVFAFNRIIAAFRPNTATFVPARGPDTPFEVFIAMELHASRLNGPDQFKRGSVGVAAQEQRVSPFVRAWAGERFNERPYLLRNPDRPDQLRVILPASVDRWIVFDAGRAEAPVTDFTPHLIGFLVIGVTLSILSAIAILRLTQPIRRFAEATERLGRDVNAEPLEIKGPSEVRQAATAFNEMQARIQAYVRDRTTMLAAISHDLRTPLTRLRLRGEFMDEDQQEKYYRDLDEMEAMITTAMDFARNEQFSEASALIDVASLLRALAEDMTESGKDVVCLYQGPAVVMELRPQAFRRALTNVVENAVAYGKVARIDMKTTPKDIVIDIDDDGPGIPPEMAEQVFAPFFRLEASRNRKTGGVGLGLATVRSILRSHGGDVALTNRPDGGLRVSLRLPR